MARTPISHIVEPAPHAIPEKNTNVIERAIINHPVKFGTVFRVIILYIYLPSTQIAMIEALIAKISE